MSWPHNADNYYFCLEINLNFGMKERFKINILLWGRRDGSLGKALAASGRGTEFGSLVPMNMPGGCAGLSYVSLAEVRIAGEDKTSIEKMPS